jgi:hypothetical protein
VIVAFSSVCGTNSALAAGLPSMSANQVSDAPDAAMDGAFVPIGLPAATPVAFDLLARNGGSYDWSVLFDPDGSSDGRTMAGGTAAIPLTPGLRATLEDVNRTENGRRFGPNRQHMDCVGYVIAKHDALIRAGLPAQALSPAVVRTRGGVVHAVLIVTTSEGDQVLDNLSPYVDPWRRVDYEWVKRQVPSGDGQRWAWIGRSTPSALKIASRR